MIYDSRKQPFNGKRLQQCRELNRLTKEDLARKLFVTEEVIEGLENGTRTPHPTIERGLATILRFPVAYFHKDDPPYFPEGSLKWHFDPDVLEDKRKQEDAGD